MKDYSEANIKWDEPGMVFRVTFEIAESSEPSMTLKEKDNKIVNKLIHLKK